MSSLGVGLVLAVLASAALNASYVLQHAGTSSAVALDWRTPLTSLRTLTGSRTWLIGASCGLAGWILAIAALSLAPLSLVQAFNAGGLALTVPVAALLLRQQPGRPELLVIALLLAALVVLALGAPAHDPRQLPPVALSAGLALAALIAAILGRAALPLVAGMRSGLAAGVCFGAADASIKAVTVSAHVNGVDGVLTPWLATAVIFSIAAFVVFQRGLQHGPVVPVVAVMTAATNVVAITIGLLVFQEPLDAGPLGPAGHLAALAVAVACAATLSALQQGDQAARTVGNPR